MAEQFIGAGPTLTSRTRRLFNVYSLGNTLLQDFSVMDAAGGPLKAVERSFPHLAPDAQGNIRVTFDPSSNYAVLNALELLDEDPGGQ